MACGFKINWNYSYNKSSCMQDHSYYAQRIFSGRNKKITQPFLAYLCVGTAKMRYFDIFATYQRSVKTINLLVVFGYRLNLVVSAPLLHLMREVDNHINSLSVNIQFYRHCT